MSSTDQNKTCAICLESVETEKAQAIFTAECSHSFHFGCIGNSVTQGNYLCPVCRATWKDLPFVFPSANANNNNVFPVSLPQPPTEPEPPRFSDDEPLPSITADPTPDTSSSRGLPSVSVKVTPERSVLAASESVSSFAVLVGLKAPSLLENTRQAQRASIDLVTVLDVSGSMHGSKLNLLKRAVNFVIDNLGPSDRLSIVSFATHAQRLLPLRRMTERGREDAKRAVNLLLARGTTNIVEGLKKGVQVLEERHQQNPVSSIIFLSDGQDTCNHGRRFHNSSLGQPPQYIRLLPASICPGNRGPGAEGEQQHTFPVHAFGFGTDHDALAMHSISDASGGTFSFIESYETVQDAFASCIGGLLSVVTQELRVIAKSASNGVQIISIPSGRFASAISNEGSQGTIIVGELYADEEKEFLINLSVPVLPNYTTESEGKTSLLDITCSYRDVVSEEMVHIECDLVEIRRPTTVAPQDVIVNLEVDRQRNRVNAAESIAEAQQMAETGNLTGAQALLSTRRTTLLASRSGQVGDGLCMWLGSEMKETEQRMASRYLYEHQGRAYALANISSHATQRATTRGSHVLGVQSVGVQSTQSTNAASFNAYATPNMANMVSKSQQLISKTDNVPPKQE